MSESLVAEASLSVMWKARYPEQSIRLATDTPDKCHLVLTHSDTHSVTPCSQKAVECPEVPSMFDLREGGWWTVRMTLFLWQSWWGWSTQTRGRTSCNKEVKGEGEWGLTDRHSVYPNVPTSTAKSFVNGIKFNLLQMVSLPVWGYLKWKRYKNNVNMTLINQSQTSKTAFIC